MELNNLTAETIMLDEVFYEIIETEDAIERDKLVAELTDKAKLLSVKSKFESRLKAFIKENKKLAAVSKKEAVMNRPAANDTCLTDFTGADNYPVLYTGNWKADDSGITSFNMFGEIQACYHPILPIERLRSAETGLEKIKIAFKKGNIWREVVVDKDIIASNNKIISLSNLGVSVTSENSKYLVKYLADVENFNYDLIPDRVSTSKMGWFDEEFLPYTNAVVFDGNDKFRTTFDSITERGSFETWLQFVKKYRSKGRKEFKFAIAASFASVLVKPLDALPFWCNIYGGTGAGKTVTEMVATSVWACPVENKYMIDFKNTDVSLEVRQDFLNNLPLVIDDTATVKEKYKDNFSELIYNLCSGKGKGRSNRSLGMNKENTWRNVILSSSENPLSNENLQGGAINRVLDLEAGDTPIFENGQEAVALIADNYGFAGKMFVNVIREIGLETIKLWQKTFLDDLKSQCKMEKQTVSLSILLTADHIASEYIFKDEENLTVEEVQCVMLEKEAVSENERCYDYILGEVAVNQSNFSNSSVNGVESYENWGTFQDGYVVILKNVFEKICKSGGFSSKGFLNWANKKGHLLPSKGRNERQKRFGDNRVWCIFLKLKDIPEDDTPFN